MAATPPPLDLAAIEAALVPHPEGLSAWAHALCELDPRVGLRAAIAAARLVEPIWNEHFAESQRFSLTLTAAQAALDCPCAACAEEARLAAIRSSQQLRGKSGRAHEAHRAALNAAEAAAFVHAPSVEAASHVFLAFLTAAKLIGPGRLIGVVQVEVLGWVLSADGPVATHVEEQLGELPAATRTATQEAGRRIRLAAALGSPVAATEAKAQGLIPTHLGDRLDQWVTDLGAAYPEAAARAALSSAELVAEANPGLDLGLDLIRSLLHESDEAIQDRVASALHKAKRGVTKSEAAYWPLWIAAWALEAVTSLHFTAARDSVCCAEKLLPKHDLLDRIQHDLLTWLGYTEPVDALRLEPPLCWAAQRRTAPKGKSTSARRKKGPAAPPCSFFHDCGERATREDGLCDDHRWRVDHPARVKSASPPPKPKPQAAPGPSSPRQAPAPEPERAEWKIGHKVRIRPSMEVTCLGEGVVVDLEFVRGTETIKAALVRFEDGPAAGVWYSINTLLPFEDLLGSKLR